MTIVQLEYFKAIVETGSFSKAAVQCFVSQPAMTIQIKALEEELEVPLFDRSKKPVVLTQAGKVMLIYADRILKEVHSARAHMETFISGIGGSLKIGIIPTLGAYLIPIFLKEFINKYEKLEVSITELITSEILHQLREGTLDVGILSTPIRSNDFITKVLFYEKFFIYASGDRERMRHNKKIRVNDLSAYNIWLLNEGNCFRDQVSDVCQLNASPIHDHGFSYESNSIESLMRIVEYQQGVTIIPELATLNLPSEQEDFLYEFESPVPSREISLLVSRSFVKTDLLEKLKAEILDHLPASIKSLDGKYKVDAGLVA